MLVERRPSSPKERKKREQKGRRTPVRSETRASSRSSSGAGVLDIFYHKERISKIVPGSLPFRLAGVEWKAEILPATKGELPSLALRELVQVGNDEEALRAARANKVDITNQVREALTANQKAMVGAEQSGELDQIGALFLEQKTLKAKLQQLEEGGPVTTAPVKDDVNVFILNPNELGEVSLQGPRPPLLLFFWRPSVTLVPQPTTVERITGQQKAHSPELASLPKTLCHVTLQKAQGWTLTNSLHLTVKFSHGEPTVTFPKPEMYPHVDETSSDNWDHTGRKYTYVSYSGTEFTICKITLRFDFSQINCGPPVDIVSSEVSILTRIHGSNAPQCTSKAEVQLPSRFGR